MTNFNPIKKKISNEDAKVLVNVPLKSSARFFNGEVFQYVEEYFYET